MQFWIEPEQSCTMTIRPAMRYGSPPGELWFLEVRRAIRSIIAQLPQACII